MHSRLSKQRRPKARKRKEKGTDKKKKKKTLTGRRRPRDDLAPKVVGARERARQQLADCRRLGHVDPHRRDVRRLGRALGVDAQHRGVDAHLAQRVALDLLGKLCDAAGAVDLHDAEGLGVLLLAGEGGDGDVGAGGAVGGDEGGVVLLLFLFSDVFKKKMSFFVFHFTRRTRAQQQPREEPERNKKK